MCSRLTMIGLSVYFVWQIGAYVSHVFVTFATIASRF